jgi:hypothetical protein
MNPPGPMPALRWRTVDRPQIRLADGLDGSGQSTISPLRP